MVAHTREVSPLGYDPFSTTITPDPYPVYARLRRSHPLYWLDAAQVWVLSRFDDVQAAARDWETFSNSDGVDLDDTGQVLGPGFFLDTDPPAHTRLRRVLHAYFNPRRLATDLTPVVERVVREHLDALDGRLRVDIVAEFAWPVPTAVTCELLGVPRADRDYLAGLLLDFIARSPGVLHPPAVAHDAARNLRAYFSALAAENQRRTTSDLMAAMISARQASELSDDELSGMAFFLFMAGIETTASLIGNALLALYAFPDERANLRDGDAEVAIEELLRYDAPLQYLARTVTRDVTFYDTRVPAGSRMVLLFGSANRDERRWPDPDRLDLARPKKLNLAFSAGIHHCIGAPLARLEGRLALPRLLRRIAHYELVGQPVRQPSHTTRGLASMPVRIVWER